MMYSIMYMELSNLRYYVMNYMPDYDNGKEHFTLDKNNRIVNTPTG